ncbi:D-xylose reductase [Ascobolus immersus RN42]|uniref:D-xylose reductase n=1 Tax=Ascobolus immersus RN42 TaxID=1160509 RepID=A0A3N4HU87_ASCIM|nr:D-xylose reductase [Ascobolus immersus RN42]
MATITLRNGEKMPQVGFGLWKVTENTAEVVENALKTGYRLLDGAADYGNEVEAGKGLKNAIEKGIVKREEVFVTSKLWNTFHDKENVVPIAKKQLADWGLDYFDLYLIHFPVSLKYVDPAVRYPPGWTNEKGEVELAKGAPLHETWAAMEELVELGLVKSIGISNMQGSLILDLLKYAKIKPAVLQIEHHPYLQQPSLIKLAKEQDIAVTAYSSFGPASFIELGWENAKETPVLFEHDTITSIAKAHNVTPAQVLLRWSTQRGLAVIPKSNNQTRLEANLKVNDFDLTEDEIKSIAKLDRGLRFNNPEDYLGTLLIFA